MNDTVPVDDEGEEGNGDDQGQAEPAVEDVRQP